MATSIAEKKDTGSNRKVNRKNLTAAKEHKQMAYAHFEAAKAVRPTQAKQALKLASADIKEAIELNPLDGDSFNLLSRIELESGSFLNAENAINKAIELAPENGGYWYSLGHVQLAKKALNEAEYAFSQAILFSPKETRAEISLAHTLLENDKHVEAFKHYREIIKTNQQDQQIRNKLLTCASYLSADYYDSELEQDLLNYLQWKDVNTDKLSRLCCSLLHHKFQMSHEGTGSDFNEISQCPLFITTLKNSLIKSELLEKLIIALRHELLNYTSNQGQLSKEFIPLCQAIGLYGWRNEFILPTTDAENNMVQAIKNMIQQSLDQFGCMPIDLSGALLLLAMYDYWDSINNSDKFMEFENDSWPDLTYGFKQLFDERIDIKSRKFEKLTEIPSATKHEVKAQYEQYPYPRWQVLDNLTPVDYGLALQYQYPEAKLPKFIFNRGLHILVAGCGTGRHAISAARGFNDCNVLALDICQHSLAYAQKKSEQLNIKNIEFKLADLTKLDNLNNKFDVIECSGVLHHIKHYKKALNNLLVNLKPKGLIKISLYSERARKPVIQIRELFKRDDLELNRHRIRVSRMAIMQSQYIDKKDGILDSDDFYSMSGTVDLLFHQFEKRFTPIGLKNLCQQHELSWLGFSNLSNKTKYLFMGLHGNNYNLKDLDQWEEFEKVYPETFSSMYQFYCQYEPKLKTLS